MSEMFMEFALFVMDSHFKVIDSSKNEKKPWCKPMPVSRVLFDLAALNEFPKSLFVMEVSRN